MLNKETLYILDLDRTLIDVEKAMDIVLEICSFLNIDENELHIKRHQMEETGLGFSPLPVIKNIAPNKLPAFKETFITQAKKQGIKFSDSDEFIAKLESKALDKMILTYGEDKDWQTLKISGAGYLNIPHIIIDDRYKSKFVNKLSDESGNFTPNLPGLGTYKSFVLIDDRERAFLNLPANGKGFLLDRAGKHSDSEHKNLTVVRSLKEIEIS